MRFLWRPSTKRRELFLWLWCGVLVLCTAPYAETLKKGLHETMDLSRKSGLKIENVLEGNRVSKLNRPHPRLAPCPRCQLITFQSCDILLSQTEPPNVYQPLHIGTQWHSLSACSKIQHDLDINILLNLFSWLATVLTHYQPPLIQIRQLDWTIPPDQWIWHDDKTIASTSHSLRASKPTVQPHH